MNRFPCTEAFLDRLGPELTGWAFLAEGEAIRTYRDQLRARKVGNPQRWDLIRLWSDLRNGVSQ